MNELVRSYSDDDLRALITSLSREIGPAQSKLAAANREWKRRHKSRKGQIGRVE